MTRLHGTPLQHSYWVDDALVAGEHPGGPDRALARERIARLLESGVRSFIDLTEPYELEPYERMLRDEAVVRNVQVRYGRFAIRDRRVPPPKHMRAILDTIVREIEAGRPTFVHCWGGMGRAGMVVGCYLVRHGRSGDEALAETARLFATIPAAGLYRHPGSSPETSAQRLFVLSWKEDTQRRLRARSRAPLPVVDPRLRAS